jgi:heat shock protein HslJ
MNDCQSIADAQGVFLETAGSGAIGNSISANVIANAATGIESANSSNDANFAQANIFRTVTTAFPRQINSNFFQNVKGISGTASNCNNLAGSVTITAGTTTTAVTFANVEPDANYRVFLSNSLQNLGVFWTDKTTSGFTINHTSPSFNRTADWFICR